MRLLVVGSGGREHALAWKIARSPMVETLIVAPGSDGIAGVARVERGVDGSDFVGITDLARREDINLVVIGPEAPLAAGIGDHLREAGFNVFGPSVGAAKLESSKGFARRFMSRYGIPQPRYACFNDFESARAHLGERDGACVVKADGLAAGKGVYVCENSEDAQIALAEIMHGRRFGESGSSVVIEDVLTGKEASFYAITDGRNVATLAVAQDHKRIEDGDRGENTGGMGAFSPTPVVNTATEKLILDKVVYPTLQGMSSEGNPYVGVLYVGLMIDAEGYPSVVEFNVRFGDPETQPLMLAMEGDLVPLLYSASRGELESNMRIPQKGSSVCVVLASKGYPRDYEVGHEIRGLDDVEDDADVVVFHAGTRKDESGIWRTAGGRVVGVTARGSDVQQACDRAYGAVDRLKFKGRTFRRDIGYRDLV